MGLELGILNFLYIMIGLVIVRKFILYVYYTYRANSKGCAPIPNYPHWDPFLGLDIAIGMARALKQDSFLHWLRWRHKNNPKTFLVNFVGSRFIWTSEAENMKAMSTANWQDFAVGPMRRKNTAAHPFADKGVNTTDGEDWKFSRFLIKPFFVREAFGNTKRLERHVDRLFGAFSGDGEVFDIQPLIQRWFLDITTEHLFGESIDSLVHAERASICWTMVDVLRGLRLRLQWYKYLWLFRHQSWLDAVQVVNDYLNRHIERTYEELEEREQGKHADK